MSAKLAAVETDAAPKTRAARKPTKRTPIKIAVTFDLVEGKLVVREVFRDMTKFADSITDDPTNIPLFAKIEVPFL